MGLRLGIGTRVFVEDWRSEFGIEIAIVIGHWESKLSREAIKIIM